MTTQELIAHLISFDELKPALAYILLFMLIESYLRKNRLYAPLKQAIEYAFNAVRCTYARLQRELEEHFEDIPSPSNTSILVSSWILITIESMLSAWMLIYAIYVTALLLLNPPSGLMLMMGLGFALLLFFGCGFYRAGAYKTAKKYKIELSPWSKT